MGLGLYLTSDNKSHRILGRIEQELSTILESLPIADWTRLHAEKQQLAAILHPSAETVDFFLNEEGVLTCSAKTSTCGPGYHAFLLRLLEQLAEKTGIRWDLGDETAYQADRSFANLQHEMLMWLRAVAGKLGEMEDTIWHVNMPIGETIADAQPGTCFTPLGPFDCQWLRQIAEDEELLTLAGSQFFPWWNDGFDPLFWKQLGMVECWCNLTWAPPVDEGRRQQYQRTLDAFQNARSLDKSIPLPKREIAEIEGLLEWDEDVPPSPPDDSGGIGYRRKRMQRLLPGPWTIELPGYYETMDEQDGETTVYWFGGRAIRGSSLSFEPKDPSQGTPDAIINDLFEREELQAELEVDLRSASPPRFAWIEEASEDNDQYWMLRGFVARRNGFCHATLCFSDPEDRSWAIEAFRTVQPRRDDDS